MWRRTPAARAAAVHATTRLATNTAAGMAGSTPAATSGQSGTHTDMVRTGQSDLYGSVTSAGHQS